MKQQTNILVVDDSIENRLILRGLLEDDYSIDEAESGEACLKKIEMQVPDLLLLDVGMPGMNGYQVCEELRKQHDTKDLPIIFVSGLDSVEERLAGFEAGGDEYVIKPVDPDDLFSKVELYLQRQREKAAARKDATDAMQIAMEAMTVSSELGQIVEFVKTGQNLKTPKAIAEAMLAISQEFQLNTSVMINNSEQLFFGCDPGSVEARFLERASNSRERVLTVGIRTVIRNDNIVLLIKDLPMADENRSGRLRDHLAVLMDIANGYLNSLNANLALARQRREFLNRIIAIAEEQIKLTSDKLHNHEKNSTHIMQSMISQLESMLFSLGLDEDQENELMRLADQTTTRLEELNRSTQDLDTELGVILESLYSFFESESLDD